MPNLKIGFTERGDAGLDTGWYEKCKNGQVDGAVIITKNLTFACQSFLLDLQKQHFPVILHCGCTGWGHTAVEPYVPDYIDQLSTLSRLIRDGFPADHTVLRIDPVFPTETGIRKMCEVIRAAKQLKLLPGIRVRISILDEYRHVKERERLLGVLPIYPGTGFQASPEQFKAVSDILATFPDITFETCAEPLLAGPNIVQRGCLSETDLRIMGLSYNENFVNPQGRGGCLCLGCKTELLTQKKRCPHKCVYCYWKD